MTEIIVVRHGESVADIEHRFEGRANFPLTEQGMSEAERAAVWIRQYHCPELIISSPLIRAAETAQIIGNHTGISVDYDDLLMEWNHGVLAGMLRTEADKKYPVPPGGRKPHQAIEGGESFLELRYRAESFISQLNSLIEDSPHHKRICIVSHGHMITMLFRSFLKLPMDTEVGLETWNTGIHIWRVNGNERSILTTNSQVHLNN